MGTRKRKNRGGVGGGGGRKHGNVSKSFRNKIACDTLVNVRGDNHKESTKNERQDSKMMFYAFAHAQSETKLRDNRPTSIYQNSA